MQQHTRDRGRRKGYRRELCQALLVEGICVRVVDIWAVEQLRCNGQLQVLKADGQEAIERRGARNEADQRVPFEVREAYKKLEQRFGLSLDIHDRSD